MQTFMPYPDFEVSAYVLDDRRLGKQRVEALQIMRALSGRGGWRHHPAVRMWRGYRDALRAYGLAVCREWKRRGYRDTVAAKLRRFTARPGRPTLPPWMGYRPFHRRHRANLLRKDPTWYGQWGWLDRPGSGYIWPVPA